nr:ABC transporter permease [Actinomycetota bacterium]
VMELFTYGTAPAYFAVLLLAGDMLLLLAFVLGGSVGYLLWGDGEPVASWSYESWIGRRFLMGKRGDSVVGIITVISVLAVAVGTCAMVVVMSVMNGFSTDLRAKIFGANAHLIVLKYGTDFTEYGKIIEDTKKVHGIIGASPFVLNELMVSSDINHTGAVLKGIDVDTIDAVSVLRKNVEKGDLDWVKNPEKIPGVSKPAGDAPPGQDGAPPAGDVPVDGAPAQDGKKSERESLDDAIAMAAKGVDKTKPEQGAVLPGVAIGSEMSKNLKVFVGDVVNVVTPIGELGPTGPVPRARAFKVAAIFHSGMYEYDSKFIYISLQQAQDFFSLNGGVTGIEYKVLDIEKTQGISREILRAVGGYPYRTKDWMEMNRNLFSALKLEKIAMFIILTFIIIVASFLIAATLIVFVIEKSKEIAILKTMGATDTSIMKVFITYGVIVGSVGTAVGLAAGLAVCLALKTFGFGLDPDVYYISDLPVYVDSVEVAVVAMAAVFLSYLATIYPALLAARLRPVEGLRYE